MRYRLMATYRGVPYEAGVGPSHADVVLFAACPPPEELGFEPATGHWRKQVIWAEVDALWESRPVGVFRGEPCVVLDDLGDRLHIAYLGTDAERAALLGYWQVDRGVYELLAPRDEVTGLTEERVDKPLRWAPPPASLPPSGKPAPQGNPYGTGAWPIQPAPGAPAANGAAPAGDNGELNGWPGPIVPAPAPAPGEFPPGRGASPVSAGVPAAAFAHGGPAGGAGRGRSARRQRVTAREVFCELADLAAIPRGAYALETEVDDAMCLLSGPDGFEVFLAVDGARHEVRLFAEEEAAYFYLFGVLAAEAIRNGALLPAATSAPLAEHSI